MAENLPVKKNPWKKKLFIGSGIILLLILLFPFAVNLYLKYNLPEILNKKTPYKISYSHFDLALLSGDITATNIKIENKNPNETKAPIIKGTLKELAIDDFGIWDALVNHNISTDAIKITQPDLQIILPPKKQKDSTKTKKLPDLHFKNIILSDGKFNVRNNDQSPVFTSEKLNINLTDVEESKDDSKIPFSFKTFKISVENIIVTINEFYQVYAVKVNAENKNLALDQFRLKPIESNPGLFNAKNVFDFSTEKLTADYISISKDSIIVNKTDFEKPFLKVVSTGKKTVKENPKEVNIKIALANIKLNKGKILVQDVAGNRKAEVKDFSLNMDDIVFDKNTVKEKIPFKFTNQNVECSNIYLKTDDLQSLEVEKVVSKDRNIAIDHIHFYPNTSKAITKDLIDIAVEKVELIQNQSKFIGQTLNVDFNKILIASPKIKIISAANKPDGKEKKSAPLDFKAKVGSVILTNGSLASVENNGTKKVNIGYFGVNLINITSDKTIAQQKIPFKVASHEISAKDIYVNSGKYYNLNVANIHSKNKSTEVDLLTFKPKYSRKEFSRIIPKEEDLYTISVKKINVNDNNSGFVKNQFNLNLANVVIDGMDTNIYRDLRPPDDNSVRYLFGHKLRNVKFPLFVKNIALKNSKLAYEEDAENPNIPGKISFDRFNADIKNVNNTMFKNLPTNVSVDGNFLFFRDAPTKVHWDFDVANLQDNFNINGTISKLSAEEVNQFVKPYLNISLEGNIDQVLFNFKGNNDKIGGKFKMEYHDLKVSILDKETHQKKKLLSAVANMVLRTNSKDDNQFVDVEKKREKTRSFFNLLWQGIMEGLKKVLI